jgi:hypothetical protein
MFLFKINALFKLVRHVSFPDMTLFIPVLSTFISICSSDPVLSNDYKPFSLHGLYAFKELDCCRVAHHGVEGDIGQQLNP